MKLVYKDSDIKVAVGDTVELRDGEEANIEYFREPRNSSSSGKITVKPIVGCSLEVYVSVIGAEWIEREDRGYEVNTIVNCDFAKLEARTLTYYNSLQISDVLLNGATVVDINRNKGIVLALRKYVTQPFVVWKIDANGRTHSGLYFTLLIDAVNEFIRTTK